MTTAATTTNRVEKLIYKMFTESTGAHILDSGGIYGRHWEKNQKLSFKEAMKLPDVTHEIYEYKDGKCELNVTVNVFKYLISCNLELDEICDKFNAIQKKSNDWDAEEFYGVSKKAEEYLKTLDVNVESEWNTYNDSVQYLSQVLQGSYIEIDQERYVLLQIHQGCDVRGGYTDAKLFKLGYWSEGYLRPCDIYGTIDGVSVDNLYNGSSFTDENGNDVEITKESKIELELMSK